jgi:exodeoxyribonuclease-3
MRQIIPSYQNIYTWWSYRAKDWDESDRGRRLDHVWGSADLEAHMKGLQILRDARGWERPSDHVPVIATFDLD